MIKTDHKPLTYAFLQRSTKSSPRQTRQLDYISQFSTDIVYIKGDDNIVADALSPISTIETPIIVTTEELAQEQEQDKELKEILQNETHSFTIKETTYRKHRYYNLLRHFHGRSATICTEEPTKTSIR